MTSPYLTVDETALNLRCDQRVFPPFDASHGTPHPMLWRKVTITTQQGAAVFEQTDYGHPGRLNVWVSRGIDQPLLPRLEQLRGLVDATEAYLERVGPA